MRTKNHHPYFGATNIVPFFIALFIFFCCSSNVFAASNPPAKVGDKVIFSDSEWTVLSASDVGSTIIATDGFSDEATTEGKFIIVKFQVKNTTKTEESIMEAPALVDSQKREFKEYDNQTPYLPEKAKTIMLESLPSSMMRTYYAMYEVPTDSKGLKFRARSLSIMTKYKLVDLDLNNSR